MSQKVVYDAPCVETLLYAKYLRIPIRTFRDLRVRTDGNNIEDLVSTEVENKGMSHTKHSTQEQDRNELYAKHRNRICSI